MITTGSFVANKTRAITH